MSVLGWKRRALVLSIKLSNAYPVSIWMGERLTLLSVADSLFISSVDVFFCFFLLFFFFFFFFFFLFVCFHHFVTHHNCSVLVCSADAIFSVCPVHVHGRMIKCGIHSYQSIWKIKGTNIPERRLVVVQALMSVYSNMGTRLLLASYCFGNVKNIHI